MEMRVGKLASASALLFIGTLASGILGYLYQIIMGRMLGPADYALLTTVLALYAIFTTPLGALMMLISRKVSEYNANARLDYLVHFFYSINVKIFVLGFFVVGIVLFFADQIQVYLKVDNLNLIYVMGVLIFLSIFPTINNAFLQGLQKFKWFSFLGALGVFLKICFSTLFVWLDFGVAGAIIGIIFSCGLVMTIGYFVLTHPLFKKGRGSSPKSHFENMAILPVLIANFSFVLMTQFDMVLVNYYFNSYEAGLYAAASVLGKAVMYLPSGIALALFPMVAENQAKNLSSSHLLVQAVLLTTMLCLMGALFYFICGDFLIFLFYGEGYQGAGNILKYFSMAMFPMALVMVAEYFLIARGVVLFSYLFALMAPLQLIAIHFFHETLLSVVFVMAASSTILVIAGYGSMWKIFRRDKV